jgi:conjugal transfer pilin signal peptidase TrbI
MTRTSLSERLQHFYQPRKSFLKVIGVISLIAFLTLPPFFSRFTFGWDGQFFSCMPGKWLFLVDAKDKQLERGAIYALRAKAFPGVFKEDQQLAKFLVGLPGDHVEANEYGLFVNGEQFADDYVAAKWLSVDPVNLYGSKVLGENEYWFMGVGKMSFDSRYYGPLPFERIVGRAYALL